MPQIKLSEKDYKDLMALIKEMREQETDFQAAPRFWHPRSSSMVVSPSGDGEAFIFDEKGDGVVSGISYAESCDDEVFSRFLDENGWDADTEPEEIDEAKFVEWICDEEEHLRVVYMIEEEQDMINPSLFKSDVSTFIKTNGYNLGDKPHTYARTIGRMRKMERLLDLLMKIK